MIMKWFFGGGLIGFIIGSIYGGSFEGGIGLGIIFGGLAIALRKWILRTFWM